MKKSFSRNIRQGIILFALASTFVLASSATAQGQLPPAQMDRIDAIAELMQSTGNEPIENFVDEHVSGGWIKKASVAQIVDYLDGLRKLTIGADDIGIDFSESGLLMKFSGSANADFLISFVDNPTFEIEHIDLVEGSTAKRPDGPPQTLSDGRHARILAVEDLARARAGDDLLAFADANFTPAYRSEFSTGELVTTIRPLVNTIARSGTIQVKVEGDYTIVEFRGPENADVRFKLESAAPFQMVDFQVDAGLAAEPFVVNVDEINWETLSDRLDQEAEAGFAGSVLAVKDGELVLSKGYGLANRETNVANTDKTLFAIASVVIDFTRVAILKLVDMEKLSMSDAISDFLSDVPDDKRRMTIAHLMSGQSGLPNYHDDTSVDDDPDLSWIDRPEAIRRILESRLLFPPGEDTSHSHSAYTLLAALVEAVDGRSYQDFLKEELFEPAELEATGFLGKDSGLDPARMAVGYGAMSGASSNEANIPANWGPTSWLVMGSGGMVSSPSDLYKFKMALRDGKILSPKVNPSAGKRSLGMGSNSQGFLTFVANRDDTSVIFTSNNHSGDDDLANAIARRLEEMVFPD